MRHFTQCICLLWLVIVLVGCGLPIQRPLPATQLIAQAHLTSANIGDVVEVNHTFSAVAYRDQRPGQTYPTLGCLIGSADSVGNGSSISNMTTASHQATESLAAKPLVVLEDVFYGSTVTCLFVHPDLISQHLSVMLIDVQGNRQFFPTTQPSGIIVISPNAQSHQSPFQAFMLVDQHNQTIYQTAGADKGFP